MHIVAEDKYRRTFRTKHRILMETGFLTQVRAQREKSRKESDDLAAVQRSPNNRRHSTTADVADTDFETLRVRFTLKTHAKNVRFFE